MFALVEVLKTLFLLPMLVQEIPPLSILSTPTYCYHAPTAFFEKNPPSFQKTASPTALEGQRVDRWAGTESPLLQPGEGASLSRRSAAKETWQRIWPFFATPSLAAADEGTKGYFDKWKCLLCLLDLPPVTPGCVRVYLCRHGETENNRLHIVTRDKEDPPLNAKGRDMSRRLGEAFARLPPASTPRVALHSLLRRSKETALLASSALKSSFIRDPQVKAMKLQALKSLGRVNFCSKANGNGGQESDVRRQDMLRLLEVWSVGLIDESPINCRERGREVRNGDSLRWNEQYFIRVQCMGSRSKAPSVQILDRVADSITKMAHVAQIYNGPVMAVSHSTFLRVVLAAALDMPLLQAALLPQENCCINVMDVDVTTKTTLGSNCNLLGGEQSLVEKDFTLSFPKVAIIRINEVRHLEGL